MNFVDFNLAKKLKNKGFDEGCEFTFYNHYRVRDEIYEKHPGLSDDGYEDLRKKYGGPYKDEEVYGYYIEPLKLYSRNSTIGINPITKQKVPTSELCSCPAISQVLDWMRKEKKLYIEPCILADSDTDADGKIINEYVYWSFVITSIETGDMIYFDKYEHIDYKRFDSYEESAMAGIEYVLDNLIVGEYEEI